MTSIQKELYNAYIGYLRKPGANTIAYYKLNGNLNDSSGNGYNAIDSGGTITYTDNYATFSSGWARFDNGYSSGTTTDDITISLRCKDIAASGGEGNMFVLGQDGFGNGWGALMQLNGTTPNEYLAMCVSNGTMKQSSAYSASGGVWHNLVQTISPSNTEMKFYIDGTLKETVTISSNIRIDGKSAIGKTGNYSHSVSGSISEIICESKVRTSQEISDYYNNTKYLYGIN